MILHASRLWPIVCVTAHRTVFVFERAPRLTKIVTTSFHEIHAPFDLARTKRKSFDDFTRKPSNIKYDGPGGVQSSF